MHVDRILHDYADAGAVNLQSALWGFVDEHTFLTKAGPVGGGLPHSRTGHRSAPRLRRVWSALVVGLRASRGTSALPIIEEFRAASIPGLLRSTSA
jgi:hypothetical protein